MKYFWKIAHVGFYASLVLFLIGGAALVLTQFGAVTSLNAGLVSSANAVMGPVTFSLATICGLFAFALSYLPEGERAAA